MLTLHTKDAQLAYERSGQGPAVLLIQGVGTVGEGWRPQVEGLADSFTLISFDNRGIGRSTIEGPLSIETMAADALAIMRAEHLDQFHVVGHSMGGLIAQEVALSAPGQVKSLSLLCTFAAGKQGSTPSASMLVTALRTRIGTRPMRRRAFLELVMPRAVLAEFDHEALAEQLAPLFGHDLADQPAIVMKQLRAMSRYDARARLGRLAGIPTLVVTALEDRIARPRFGRQLAAAIPGASLVELPQAGHGVPIHNAARINELLRGHFLTAASPAAAVLGTS
jgi:pimeloyl-ACP methyl ester carboxylesterase